MSHLEEGHCTQFQVLRKWSWPPRGFPLLPKVVWGPIPLWNRSLGTGGHWRSHSLASGPLGTALPQRKDASQPHGSPCRCADHGHVRMSKSSPCECHPLCVFLFQRPFL